MLLKHRLARNSYPVRCETEAGAGKHSGKATNNGCQQVVICVYGLTACNLQHVQLDEISWGSLISEKAVFKNIDEG
jgi:hypothetical protein